MRLAEHERALVLMRRRWERVVQRSGAKERDTLENALIKSRDALGRWRASEGERIEAAIKGVRSLFPDLATPASTSPRLALDEARERVEADRARLSAQVAREDADAKRLEELENAITHARGRLTILDRETGALAADAGALAAALAALAPHVHGDDCPVCGRNFAEVGEGPLAARVAAEVARLGEQAERLQALARERAPVSAQLGKDVSERDALAKRRLAEDRLFQLKQRLTRLEEAAAALAGLDEAASRGRDLVERESAARLALADLRSRDTDAGDLRAEVEALCRQVGAPPLGDAEPLDAALKRVANWVEQEAERVRAAGAARGEARDLLAALVRAESEVSELRADVGRQTAELRTASDGLNRAANQRAAARSVAKAAAAARASVIGRVFNESLNKVWRDLFVRLAPSEPFVPRFKVPDTAGARDPVNLETGHPSRGSGGTPGAMLSAGNLNTAALTLFLALHLSVEAQLPWLILDDSVQSMDEVHIAQFAVLLRTLSKEHERQVLIAVQDRQLFDYLKLELSPSFPDDRLITVEFSRSSALKTRAVSTPIEYKPDSAISPLAA